MGKMPTEAETRGHHSGQNGESEFDRFSGFMKRLVAVPHGEIKAKLDAEKLSKARKRKSKQASVSRAAIAKN
jgi:hypothetical protein